MGKIFPHRHRGHRPRRVADIVIAPAAPVIDHEKIAREFEAQSRLETARRERTLARLESRRRTGETRDITLARLESMALNATFPWSFLRAERDLLIKAGFRPNQRWPHLSIGACWSCAALFGAQMGEFYQTLTGVKLPRNLEQQVAATCPQSVDPDCIADIIDFLIATLPIFKRINDDQIAKFRVIVERCAQSLLKRHRAIYERIQRGEITDVRVQDLPGGWFYIVGKPGVLDDPSIKGIVIKDPTPLFDGKGGR
jgi:hypothetical protein